MMISGAFRNLSRVCSASGPSRTALQARYNQLGMVFKNAASNKESDNLTRELQEANAMRIICQKTYPQMTPEEKKIVDAFQDMMLEEGCGAILPNTALDAIQAQLNDLSAEER